jgi:peptide/nickel transport system permease protein
MDFKNLLQPPSLKAVLGTDGLGRDLFSRIVYGGRTSFLVGLIAITIASGLGVFIGLTAGYFGGKVDSLVMRGIDVLLAFPAFVLALALTTSFGFGLFSMTVAIGISYTPNFARIARGSVLTVREEEFVEAARSIGLKDLNIMVFEILPNCLAPIIVQATIAIGFAIIMESGLSFLGVGIQPPGFSWGTMLADGREYLSRAPWIVTFAGVLITLAVLGMNLLGDGLRDTLDARLKTEVRNT